MVDADAQRCGMNEADDTTRSFIARRISSLEFEIRNFETDFSIETNAPPECDAK